MRVIEAAAAGAIVGAVIALIAWRAGADPVMAAGVAFLIGFAGWGARGKTTTRYGRRR